MCAMAGELLKLSLVLSSCKKRTDTKVNNILVLVMYLEVCFMVFIDPTNCITVSVYVAAVAGCWRMAVIITSSGLLAKHMSLVF